MPLSRRQLGAGDIAAPLRHGAGEGRRTAAPQG
jgi:hypothetical protein